MARDSGKRGLAVGGVVALTAMHLAFAAGAAHGQELTPTGIVGGDLFGADVAIDGNRAAIGAPASAGDGRGAVFVFDRTAAGWAQSAKLELPPGLSGTLGTAVDLEGSTVVAGAPDAAPDGVSEAGVVYVFDLATPAASPAALTASDRTAGARLGSSVAIDGATLAAGAPAAPPQDPATSSTGAVYLFDRPIAGSANERAKLIRSTPTSSLGTSVDLDDGVVVAGSDTLNVMSATSFPATATGVTTELARFDVLTGGRYPKRSPTPVAIEGDTIVAGSPDTDVAYLFPAASTGAATNTGALIPSDPRRSYAFGARVAIADGAIVVSAVSQVNNSFAGAVYHFDLGRALAGAKTEAGRVSLIESGAYLNDLALDEGTILIGDPFEQNPANPGFASAFALPPDDTSPPKVRLRAKPAGRAGAVRLKVRCSEDCTALISGFLDTKPGVGIGYERKQTELTANEAVIVKLKPKKAIDDDQIPQGVSIEVQAADASGYTSVKRLTLRNLR